MDRSYVERYQSLWRDHWWWQARHRVVIRKLRKLTRTMELPKLLDIGCCGGIAFDDFSRFGEIWGLEPDPWLANSIPRWGERIRLEAFSADYQSLQEYDLVLILDVLEHIEDDAGALAALYRLVKPGGYVILTVPALQSLWSIHDTINHHYRRYRAEGLRQLFVDQGFEILDLRYLFSWSLGLLYLYRRVVVNAAKPYEVRPPAKPINAVCRWLSQLEAFLPMPLGSSLLAVARRPISQTTKLAPGTPHPAHTGVAR